MILQKMDSPLVGRLKPFNSDELYFLHFLFPPSYSRANQVIHCLPFNAPQLSRSVISNKQVALDKCIMNVFCKPMS